MDGNLPNLPDLPLRLIEDGLIAKVFIDPSRDSSSHSTSSRRDQVGNKGENDNLFSWAPARAWARQLTDHSVAGYRSVTRPIFFSFFFLFFSSLPRGCPHVLLFRACTATISQPSRLHGSVFTKILSLFPRTLSARDVCRRILQATPQPSWERTGSGKKKRAKGRRLRASPSAR